MLLSIEPELLKNVLPENQIIYMEWTAQSSDLYLIENVWRKLKIELQKQAHNITSVTVLEKAIRNI